MDDQFSGWVELLWETFETGRIFLLSASAQLLPVCSQLYHHFPQPPFGSKTYSLGFVLTKLLQRVTCSPFPFAHEQIIQEAKVLGLKGPEVGNRH